MDTDVRRNVPFPTERERLKDEFGVLCSDAVPWGRVSGEISWGNNNTKGEGGTA